MTSALVSALTGIPLRRDVAMTGEITLRGHVLPIGGLNEMEHQGFSSAMIKGIVTSAVRAGGLYKAPEE